MLLPTEDRAFTLLRQTLESYSPISDETWQAFKKICTLRSLPKGSFLYKVGELPTAFSYVFQGLVRCFVCDEKGNEYNKNFFDEGTFPGSMSALLTSIPSAVTFETIEDTLLIEINFLAYRKLLIETDDLKLFQIYYLEKNWLQAKDSRETELCKTTLLHDIYVLSINIGALLTDYRNTISPLIWGSHQHN
jgi:CRP-like cAMP-binding protein